MITLKRGATGRLVHYLQKRLDKLGEKGDGLVADGYFGEVTEGAVIDFQVRWDLSSDGIVGPRTWASLLQTGGELTGGDIAVKAEAYDMLLEMLEGAGASEAGQELVERAWTYLGAQERPWGSNKGPDIVKLVQGTKVTGQEKLKQSEYKLHWGIHSAWSFPPWCAIAVSSWMAEAFDATKWSEIPFGNWFGGVTQTARWAEKRGVYRKVSEGVSVSARPGELFIMGRAGSGSDEAQGFPAHAGHIGVVAWDEGDALMTIEGNAGNAVRFKRRSKGAILGLVDWEGVK